MGYPCYPVSSSEHPAIVGGTSSRPDLLEVESGSGTGYNNVSCAPRQASQKHSDAHFLHLQRWR